MKVLISGYYGCGNIGDEAVLEAILKGLRQRAPGLGLTVLSAQPELTSMFNEVKAVRRSGLFGVLRALDEADILISGGGSLFQDKTSARSFLYYIGLVGLAKLFGKKVMIFGQGFGPLRGRLNRAIARAVVEKVDLITLRDEDSLNEIRRLGVKNGNIHVTADPTFILGEGDKEQGRKVLALEHVPAGKALLGVAVRQSIDTGRLAEQLDIICEKYKLAPVFLPFHFPEDLGESRKVIEQMRTKSQVVFRSCGPEEMRGIFPHLELLIGLRLHGLIFAAANKVPMVGISYDPKVASFMRSIGQPCLELTEVDQLGKQLAAVLADKEQIKAELAAAAGNLYNKAKLNFDLFFERFGQ
ncbi:polysaccharide pyruvyl transferase CsaB [candidate division WOR-1 bacterium RIFCSPHIGHO2_02_FULL_53_26]|nr:MAG: polysaccharide pyruvyl transferase CsaB [candidate division WOR-1 bacterium RIFCSPHIGHO2_02_FULL_53_26]